MSWFPISHTVPQYVDGNGDPYSGAVLKAYASGTSTNISMATDSTGAVMSSSMALDSNGYPSISGNVIIPHLEEKYKLALYPTQVAADADSGAIWTQDKISIAQELGSVTQNISSNITLDSSDNFNHLEVTGTTIINLPDISAIGAGYVNTIRNAGTGVVTLNPDGSEIINGSSTLILRPGESAVIFSGTINWSAIAYVADMNVVEVNSASNITNINCQLGDIFSHILTEDTDFIFKNPNSSGIFTGFVLYLTNDTIGRVPIWPNSVHWDGGVEPVLTAANEVNILTFTTIDGGNIWHGAVASRASS